MAMFGRKKPMYQGMDPDYNARNIHIGQAPVSGTIPMGQMQPQGERFKPNILGVIGDAMQVFGGGQATYMQGMQAEQQRAQMLRDRADQQQQQREYDWQDWTRKQEYERQNPAPVNNDTVNDLNWYKSLSDDDRKLYHQMKPTITYRADGTPMAVNPYDLRKSGGNLDDVPVSEEGYDYTPGQGGRANPANWKKGGGVGNGTGGFRN